MIQSIKNISIPEPCSQNWDGMTPSTGGRHCAHCCKTVTDFTVMSNQQIIDLLSNSNKICGRFEPWQVEHINRDLRAISNRKSFWKHLALMAGILLLSNQSKSQTTTKKPGTEQIDEKKIPGEMASQDSTRFKTITGTVLSVSDGLPLPGTTIKVSGTTIGTMANENGNFTLKVPQSATELTITFIGFEMQTVRIAATDSQQEIKLLLKMKEMMMGEVIIKRPPFFKRVYYRFVKQPVKKYLNNRY
ncbi:carboxypeptidase-like regulatory domain-containing protein [Mucilaginibacter mali]|uniref:Carboxypeptidase-like regulatory domain-containing protein n=1 Tax=Mucilaginibacter mali TaxID=2740462 RepID=A0A7D4TMG2_9SPHI|nr:carboxypeptidase-like regulatory domain-containing protein [Mucilaginibacter mali]QKJ30013.1 carboxypeptidase-like regulatory domain-containing protein [Mucilaginibacter mali]